VDPSALTGATYGPFTVTVPPSRVADFVAATGDDADRWRDAAPPGYGAVVLFTAAPSLLDAGEVAGHTRSLLHSDQSFAWHRPIAVGGDLTVHAGVTSVRERSGMYFVGFDVAAENGAGPVLDSSSTFVLSAAPAADPPPDAPEPGPRERGPNDPVVPLPLPGAGAALPGLVRSASRLDLVRYAAASGDWNPIHWDHASARAAGLGGIVVHGLLMAAWVAQAVGRCGPSDAPVASLSLRFRRPLAAGAAATVDAVVGAAAGGTADLTVEVTSAGVRLVTGRATVRTA
jgi:acyl dehydratase